MAIENEPIRVFKFCFHLSQAQRYLFNSAMAKGGGGEGWHPQVFQFFSGMGRAFWQTKFLAVCSSLHWASVHEDIFQI